MNNTLWTFGDSFTYGDGCHPPTIHDTAPVSYYKETFNPSAPQAIFPELLSKSLKMKLNNISMAGGSNSYILRSIVGNIDKIKTGDVVVLGYTDPWRFEIPGVGNSMHPVLINSIEGYDTFNEAHDIGYNQNKRMNDAMVNYCEEIHMMKLYRTPSNEMMEEVYGYEVLDREVKTQFNSLIKHFKNNKIKVVTFNWDTHEFRYESISIATNNTIQNYHLSWKGHQDLHNDILKFLQRNDILNLKTSIHLNSYITNKPITLI